MSISIFRFPQLCASTLRATSIWSQIPCICPHSWPIKLIQNLYIVLLFFFPAKAAITIRQILHITKNKTICALSPSISS